MSKKPTVSTVITTFNRPHGLRRALQSVQEQQLQDQEVLVVNDAGADISEAVSQARKSLPVRTINLPTNRGVAVARKVGLTAARGDFVAMLDDDDMWLPQHLITAVDKLNSSEADIVYTTCLVAPTLPEPGKAVTARHRLATPFCRDLLAVTNPTPATSVVSRRFDTGDPAMHARGAVQDDWAMWLGLVLGHGWRMIHTDVATTVHQKFAPGSADVGDTTALAARVRRYATGHHLLHRRWPVAPGSAAAQTRWLIDRMYELADTRLLSGSPISPYYYEKAIPIIASAVAGTVEGPEAEQALAAAVAPRPSPTNHS